VAVRERDAGKLAIGQPATIEVDARPGETFRGQIVRLAPGFDPVTRTLDAEVHLGNPDGALRPGMYGRATLRLGVHPQAAVLPESALQVVGSDRFVYVVEGERARRRPVSVGIDGGTWVEIARGLRPEDEVIVAGSEGVADGLPVRPVRGVSAYSGAKAQE
jgi:membrane fusion protein (multidrug efflux system)